jgi:sugar lactone lactonase YvrE
MRLKAKQADFKIPKLWLQLFIGQANGSIDFCCCFLFLIFLLAFSEAQAQTTNYTLGTSNLLVGPTLGTNSVALAVTPGTNTWTATANDPWLHLDSANQAGIGSTNVIFTYDANQSATRLGTLTVGDQTLTVTQAGSTYVAAGILTALVSSKETNYSGGMALDDVGNVFFSDTWSNTVRKWTAADNSVATLVSSGLKEPAGLAVDGAGNVYIADIYDNAIKEWSPANSNLATLFEAGLPCDVALYGSNVYAVSVASGYIVKWAQPDNGPTKLTYAGSQPVALKLDIAGNIYIADQTGSILEWFSASETLTTLVSSNLIVPNGLAMDGSGNLYIADAADTNTVKEWTAANHTLITLVPSGLAYTGGVAVDGSGNVFIADQGTNEILELPRAFVDPTPKLEGLAAGSDSLPPVLPVTENLLPPFAPTSDQSWLTITGITNDLVSFSFTTNAGPARTAHITLLGKSFPLRKARLAQHRP